jgi:hypothetical protein
MNERGDVTIIRVRAVSEGGEALFWFGGRDVEGWGFRRVFLASRLLRGGTLLPFENIGPVLKFFFVKLVLPFGFRFFAVFTIVAAFVATRAVAAFDIIEELALGLRGYFVAVNDSIQVRPFETRREFGGLFVVRSACEVRMVGLVAGFRWVFLVLGVICFCLVPFFLGRLGFREVEEVSDGSFHTPEIRRVGAGVDGAFKLVQSITIFTRPIFLMQVVTNRWAIVEDSRLLGRHLANQNLQVKGFREGNGGT